jgi:4-amino-4-deoxy-L-arabinose transferase-like glycosyltransferase
VQTDTRLRRQFVVLPLVSIIFIWGILYLPHLRTSPRWYGDETLTLMIGRSVFNGAPADRSFTPTFWHPSYSYQPGYAWLVGGFSWLSGGDIIGARALNTLLALSIACLLYFGSRSIVGILPAWAAALLFLAYDQTVIHFRWIYPHNAVALGFLICVLALLRKAAAKPDWLAGIGLSIAALSHPLFAHGAIAAGLCRIKSPRSWIPLALPPFIALVLTMGITLMRQWPHHWLSQDLATLLQFYRQYSDEFGGDGKVFRNFFYFFTEDFFHVGAFIGLLLCCRRRLYPIALFAFIVAFFLLQNRQNIPLFYYQAIVFLPILALAWAGGIRTLTDFLRRRLHWKSRVHVLQGAAFLIPIVLTLLIAPASLKGKLISRNDIWVTQDTTEVQKAAEFINLHTSKDDLVIGNSNIGWLLHCRNADYIQATAWAGLNTFTFDPSPPKERFLFAPDLNAAKYAVIGDIEQRWTFSQPNVSTLVKKLADDKWIIVWQGPNYTIAQNPRLR